MRAHPDLPILDELGAEFVALIDAELQGSAPVARPERARLRPASPRRGAHARRIARRASVVLVLLCLIGSAALAARFAGNDDLPANTTPALLGEQDDGSWQLSAYRDRDRLCLLFEAAGEPVARCGGEPRASGLRATSAIVRGQRFLFGIAGPRVEAVAARLDGFERTIVTRTPTDADAAHVAGVPDGGRWFAIPVPPADSGPSRRPVTLVALGPDGRPLGQPYVECSLGVVGPACEQQVRERAAVAAR